MRIKQKTLDSLTEALDTLRPETISTGLLIYFPNEDLINGILLPSYIEKYMAVKFPTEQDSQRESKQGKPFANIPMLNKQYMDKIRSYNNGYDQVKVGQGRVLSIGEGNDETRIGTRVKWADTSASQVIPVYFHGSGYGIIPLKEEIENIKQIAAPAGVIGSIEAKKGYRMQIPFVAFYNTIKKNYDGIKPQFATSLEKKLAEAERALSLMIAPIVEVV